jgi:hypothetical protein
VPLAWLALRDAEPGAALRRAGALAAVFLVLSATLLVAPERDSEARAAEWLAPHLRAGDLVGVHWMTTYEPYPFLGESGARPVPLSSAKTPPEFILGRGPLPDTTGYVRLAEVHERYLLRADQPAYAYAREDVAAARGLPVNETVWAS